MIEREIEYSDGSTNLKGFLASADSSRRPGILIAHPWSGRNEFVLEKARYLAGLGYAGFALDMYGEAKTATDKETCNALMTPFMVDRTKVVSRMAAALETLQGQPEVDATRTGAIGFCFGGLCVLDLARSGANIRGVASFHGLLSPAPETQKITSKVLVLHGFEDPMVKPDVMVAFAKEMTEAGADWQIHAYGNTMHAFTNPNANDPGFGTVYNKDAERRSFLAMESFFKEIF